MNATERKIAMTILKLEDALVTGPASLRITRLPSEDKGGTWEICGICDGIEPEVFHKIKALLESGNREQAWENCLQYVIDNTQAVRTWIGNDSHPAVEAFLRDHYFNSGSRNTGKILQRTLNINGASLIVDGIVGKNTQTALQNLLYQGNEHAFLSDLRDQRKAFYLSCMQFSTFGKGWLRRNDAAYNFALTLL